MSHSNRKIAAARFGAFAMAAVALGCAALAALMVGNMLSAKGYTGKRVKPIVVAATALSAAKPLTPADLEIRDWPEDSVPQGAFATVEELFASDEAPVASTGILKGEPVVQSRLTTTQTGTGVSRLVRPNMRAVALRVDDAIGYTGLVYPGASVDVVVTIRDPEGRGPSSRIAVQAARVLTVGADTDVATRRARSDEEADRLTGTPKQGGTYLTLEVSPEEAEMLAMARREGKIDIALRNGADDTMVETAGSRPVELGAFQEEALADLLAAAAPNPGKVVPSRAKARRSSAARRARKTRQKARLKMGADEDIDHRRKQPAGIETYHAR